MKNEENKPQMNADSADENWTLIFTDWTDLFVICKSAICNPQSAIT